jgi:hypothetical protein
MTDIVAPAEWFVPPYPKALVPDYSGYAPGAVSGASGGTGAADGGASSQVPTSYDLSWVAGDTVEFKFFFPNVCWVEVDPGSTQALWEYTTWRSQVRTSHYYYYGYWWPPTFPMGARIMEFVCTAEYVEDDPDKGTGTWVTLRGGTSWPGDFKWDLQSEAHTSTLDPYFYEAHTWYQGNVKVLPQYTSPTLYPPSNWPVYSFDSNPWPHQGPYLYP